jgi:hypothetical protein
VDSEGSQVWGLPGLHGGDHVSKKIWGAFIINMFDFTAIFKASDRPLLKFSKITELMNIMISWE